MDNSFACRCCGNLLDSNVSVCQKCGETSPKPAKQPKLLACRKCASRVSENAGKCPGCGARSRFDFIKLWLTAIIAFGLLMSWALFFADKKALENPNSNATLAIFGGALVAAIYLVESVFKTLERDTW